ncbi:sacsin N-terminal ATP-binding-like domain-containing protein [Parafrankia sp. EUN1f]|uniref:sacsin N-terminal ATP-binding-like domain-containing protein n=1 Tax=Parafrankia sp. EUN1f TaxID=102897 RepID=UPI0001C467F4|nr:hypothetical protein [Parafrankia sp. EUN1f]EFC81031.1 hypothetical protein FrEUN1fDRAFT_5864 [Parafrankia sp. EUN1f]
MDVTPFDTETLRTRVTEAWAASPSRFREDANAEEDAALGAYRDRLLVELLQNAVDAATAAGVPARVLVRLRSKPAPTGPGRTDPGTTELGTTELGMTESGGLLEIANTGAPLTAAGVEALSTLRASAKRDVQAVGRFGAGFAAVLAVTQTPSIVSRTLPSGDGDGDGDSGGDSGGGGAADGWRGVGWSRSRTAELVRTSGVDALVHELDRRAGQVPVLRLPFTLDDPPAGPAGYDTVVRLPLSDEAAVATARGLIGELDPTLPLVLRGLEEIVIDLDGEVRTLRCEWEPSRPGPNGTDLEVATIEGTRWRGCVYRGGIPPELLADRPVEERGRTGYTARAMVPDGDWPGDVTRVVRAPQPTDEPISIPALISVDLPLDPSRRHTVPGPLRDWLTDRLAEATVALAIHLGNPADRQPPGPARLAALDLVPTGLPRGEVDGRLRDRLLALLPDAPLFPGGRTGRDCAVLDLGPATDPVTDLLLPTTATTGAGSTTSDSAAGDGGAADDDARHDGLHDGLHDDGTEEGAEDDAIIDGLLPARFAARRRRPALDLLGVRRLDTGGVVELLRGVRRDPSWWANLYPILLTVPDRDALGALPIPVVVVPEADDLDRWSAFGPEGGAQPVADGSDPVTPPPSRMVTGPRGALLPTPDLDVVSLVRSGLPLRVVHPDACTGTARDALRTLGALEGTPAGVLRDPAVREAVVQADPEDDPDDLDALANGVLALVRDAIVEHSHARADGSATGPVPGQDTDTDTDSGLTADQHADSADAHEDAGSPTGSGRPAMPGWLTALLLPELDGGFAPAAELVIAGGPLDLLLADDAPFGTLDPHVSNAWPVHVLEAVGVLHTFGVLRAVEVTLDPDEPVLLELDDSDTWVDEAYESSERATPEVPGAPLVVERFAAVRDLELVDEEAWPAALAELARPPLRRVVLGREPSYTRWWLARHTTLPTADGSGARLPPRELVLPGADPLLTGLFAPATPLPGVDDELLRALGARRTLDDVLTDPDAVIDLLDRLGDSDREIGWPAARTLYMAAVSAAGLLGADPDGVVGPRLDPPLTVRTPAGVFPADEVVVVDAPDLLAVVGDGRPILRLPLDRAAEAAHVLGLRLASDLDDFEPVDVPAGTDAAGDGEATSRTVVVSGSRVVLDHLAADESEPGPEDLHGTDLAAAPGAVRPLVARYHLHPQLWITVPGGRQARVPWRVIGGIGGVIHVDAEAGTDALARALAWQAGQWERRHGLAAALRDPDGAPLRQAEDDLDDL